MKDSIYNNCHSKKDQHLSCSVYQYKKQRHFSQYCSKICGVYELYLLARVLTCSQLSVIHLDRSLRLSIRMVQQWQQNHQHDQNQDDRYRNTRWFKPALLSPPVMVDFDAFLAIPSIYTTRF